MERAVETFVKTHRQQAVSGSKNKLEGRERKERQRSEENAF